MKQKQKQKQIYIIMKTAIIGFENDLSDSNPVPVFRNTIEGVHDDLEIAKATLAEMIIPYKNDPTLEIEFPEPGNENESIWFSQDDIAIISFRIISFNADKDDYEFIKKYEMSEDLSTEFIIRN